MAPLEDDVEEGEITVGEDVEPLRVAPSPKQPTVQEVEAHRWAHLPYRSWCKWCVMGRGRGEAHHSFSTRSGVPIVGIDYFFITRGGVKKRNELDQAQDRGGDAEVEAARNAGEIIKCILIRCFNSKFIFAHCIPCKGADEETYVANLVADDIIWLGHLRCIVKSDNEPSLKALIQQSLDAVRIKNGHAMEQITTESAPRYDSQANGGIEVGVRNMRGLFRTPQALLGNEDRQVHPVRPCHYPVAA